jgi:hypothetical protein
MSPNTGPLAAAAWLASFEVVPPGARWYVEVVLGIDPRFYLDVYSEEWGFRFVHGERTSWIRVTDIPFVHGRDDHGLLPDTPRLGAIGRLLGKLEATLGVAIPRDPVLVRTNVPEAEAKVRAWISTQ